MPNIAAVLKEEIRRLARKEVRAGVSITKRAVAQYRREIAKLKRVLQFQQKKISRLESKQEGGSAAAEELTEPLRFSARSVRAQRKRLKLSAADYGKLIGVSGLSVYNWEHGKSRPRKSQFAALVAVRGIGRREAQKRLAEVKTVKKARRKPR